MGSIQRSGVLIGIILLAGCAGGAQVGVADRGTAAYFESAAETPPSNRPPPSGPLAWWRVAPRFRIGADNLATDVSDWSRRGKNAADAARVVNQLAEALDAMPRTDGQRAVGTADAIRAIGVSLQAEPVDAAAQRRAIGDALFIASWQMTADAQRSYASDPDVEQAAQNLRNAAVSIFETGADAPIEDGLIAARDAVQAFQISIARGRVTMSSN